MRQIFTQDEKEKKKKRNHIAIGAILAVLMVLSTAGFAFINTNFSGNSGGNNKENYNGFEFVLENNGLWGINSQGNKFFFRYSPKEVETINVPYINLGNYYGKILYFVSDDSRVEREIASVLQFYALRIQYACIEGKKCENEELPVKNCDENVIVIDESNDTKISTDNNCVFITGKSSDKIKAADAFLYKLLGIIQ